jgi:hypothetical protein
MTAARRPLCGHCVDGFEVDPETLLPARRCPCRYDPTLTGDIARDEGIAATVDAHRDAMRAALAIIRETALSQPTFSSNDTRHRMRLAQIPGEVIGAAFRQAAKDRVIRKVGYVTSADPGTHSHPVAEWESRVYRVHGGAA